MTYVTDQIVYIEYENTTKVILLTAVVRDIGFENVTDMSLSES